MNLSGHTIPYAVLGHPIGHTLSPVMHNASIQALGMDAVYLAFDVHPDRLMKVLPAMQDMGFGGVNLTVPLKEVAFKGLYLLDESAQRLGAVNTIEFTDDGIKGHNTDGAGFLLAIQEAFQTNVKGLSVFVVGSGGAGRAIALTCASENAGSVTVTDIDLARAEKLEQELVHHFPKVKIHHATPDKKTWIEAANQADLIIQATPVGMKPDDTSLLGAEAFHKGQMVFDLIYMYPQTPFMQAASTNGAKTANGLGMLLHQGAHAFTIWTGKDPDVKAMRMALEKEVYG